MALVAIGFLVATLGAAVGGVANDPAGLAIGLGVPLVFLMVILQRRVTVFDPRDKVVHHESRSLLFRTRDDQHPLSEILGVETFQGYGNYAHAPALELVLAGDAVPRRIVVLAGADIVPGHAKRISRLRKRVMAWLEKD